SFFIFFGTLAWCRSVLCFHGQAYRITAFIYFGHSHHHLLLYLNYFVWIRYKTVSQLAKVNQTILMHTNIHKSTEIGNVSNNPRQSHTYTQIGNTIYTISERESLKLFTRISSGFGQLSKNVVQGR